MLNMNRVTLLGHAGRNPEMRTIKSGEKTATFSLATTDKWRRKDGGTGEATEWHRIVVFGAAVDAAETGDPGGPLDAPVQTGEPDGSTPFPGQL